jgi:hypothetical protein
MDSEPERGVAVRPTVDERLVGCEFTVLFQEREQSDRL